MGHGLVVLVGDGDMIEPCTSAVMDLFGFGGKDIAGIGWFGKVDGSVECY